MKHTLTRLAAATALALASTLSANAASAAQACVDFDAYVNGEWLAKTELPPSRARSGSFDALAQANDRLLEQALNELVAETQRQSTPGLKLLATEYRAAIDPAAIERQGLAPLKPLLARVAEVQRAQLPALLGELARLQAGGPLGVFVAPDRRNTARHLLSISQAGLGLPDRDDYTRQDANAQRVQQAYRVYVQALLAAADRPVSPEQVNELLAFEAEMAAATLTRADRRNPQITDQRFGIDALAQLAPGLDWKAFLAAWGLPAAQMDGLQIGVAQTAHAQKLAQLVGSAPLERWQRYLTLRLLDAHAERGPRALADAHFAYYGTALRGLQAPPPRAEQVIQIVGGRTGGNTLGETLGELFVGKAFSPRARERAEQMLADIKAAMHRRIDGLAWMSAPTKQLAHAKLDSMRAKIGSPLRWQTWPGLALQPDDFLGNQLRLGAWASDQALERLSQPVDRDRWTMGPHVVNAQASFGNQIIFPAGILQPPFFDENADDASNYGGIGMVIGHEITHHFDDNGRQFDAQGNLRDWWQPEDAAAYKARADRVVALYEAQEPAAGVHINGRATLGENLSDIGGIQIAFEGLQIALTRERTAGRTPAAIDGLSPEQRFFRSNALIWRVKQRPESLVTQLRTDSHSPGRYRVLLPMAQIAAFGKAWSCKPGDPMVATDPIVIW